MSLLVSVSVHEGVDNGRDVELPQVGVLLSDANEDDGLAGGVDHVDGGSDLRVDSVKLGHNDSIDCARIGIIDSIVNQLLVELGELVNGIIADKSLAHEENHIRRVDVNKLSELAHESFVSLHSSSRVDQDHVVVPVLGI